jgi:hypothetical protein
MNLVSILGLLLIKNTGKINGKNTFRTFFRDLDRVNCRSWNFLQTFFIRFQTTIDGSQTLQYHRNENYVL